MKTKLFIFATLLFAFSSCVKDAIYNTSELQTRAVDEGIFYYYGIEDRKIFVDEVPDKLYVKYAADGEAQVMNATKFAAMRTTREVASATKMFRYKGSEFAITDEFIVKLKSGTSYGDLQRLATENGCEIGAENEFVEDQYMLYVPAESELNSMQMANRFYETGLFEFSEPNFIDFNTLASSDTYYKKQWPLHNDATEGGMANNDMKVEQAWTITKGNANIKIAVVDTGVELTHPDLQGNLLPGYDATGKGTAGGVFYDDDKHGTAVTGIIAAVQNSIGISGVAPNCKIIPVKAGTDRDNINRDQAVNGINWAVANGADVINMSFASQSNLSSFQYNAIRNANLNGRNGKGCVVVAASGNTSSGAILNSVGSFARLAETIAVGSMNPSGNRPSSSNYGGGLDVAAPGTGIYTTDRTGNLGYNPDGFITVGDPNYTPDFAGTSAATPHVAGVAALILSVNPNLTSKQVREIICQTANKIKDYEYDYESGHINGTWNEEMGHGLVDAYAAVQAAMPNQSVSGGHIFSSQTGVYDGQAVVLSYDQSPRGGNWNYAYQWQMRIYKPYWGMMDWVDIPATTAETLQLDHYAMSKETHFRRKVTSNGQTAYSNVLTFNPTYRIDGGFISGNETITRGSSATLTITSSSSGTTRQWEQSTDGITWASANGSSTASGFQTSSLHTRTLFRLRTSDSSGRTGYSNAHVVEVR